VKDPINIQARVVDAGAPGLTLGDLYYIFFRHKWKILLIFLVSLAGAAGLYFLRPPVYQSEAKILIRYILEAKASSPAIGAADSQVKSPDSRGENIINSEIEILTSLDLAGLVARAVGPEKILARFGGGTNDTRAAGIIRSGLTVEVPRRSNILRIVFRHPDASVVEPVLSQLVDTYLKRHVEIHQGLGVLDDFYSRQADQLRSRLSQTENELKQRKTDAQIVSLEDNKRAFIAQKERIEQDLQTTEAELAEQTAALNAIQKLRPSQTAQPTSDTGISPEIAERYRNVCAELDTLKQQKSHLSIRFTEEHPQVRRLTNEIAQVGIRKLQLEQENPTVVKLAPPPQAPPKGELDSTTLVLRVSALEAKLKVLTNQLAKVREQTSQIIEAEPAITQLQRRKDVEEASLRYYSSGQDQARDELLSAGKITNISQVQKPSPPGRDMMEVLKPIALILAFGLLGGFALAFVLERFLDHSIKRVVDVERQLRVPVFVSIPETGRRPIRWPKFGANGHAKSNHAANGSATNGSSSSVAPAAAAAPWDASHALRPYYEGLRDRLITFFEVREMTHKPKMIAVTSCTRGAGVTTMAAGLAATLSETGDGNVLLVDMNLQEGAVHPFRQGRPDCGLSEALEDKTRDTAMVQENLYLVSAHETNNQKLPRVLPKRFAHLVPRMKASDYDYIIFDMPPITQTSVTPRLAGFMDMVLMVIESEKTGQEIVKRAEALLNESRATVGVVLNKQRAYVPRRLCQEL
jgi:uncharacterized protein involved in exopolysaccharide biosynthesis/Mrp family chromosome partitioning ATPase